MNSTRTRTLTSGLALGLLASLTAVGAADAATASYRLTVISAPDGARTGAQAVDISDGGQVAANGSSAFVGNGSSARWLQTSTAPSTTVKAIAPNGATAGTHATQGPSPTNGVRWNATARPTTLDNPLNLQPFTATISSMATNSAGTTVVTYENYPRPVCVGIASFNSAGRGTAFPAPPPGNCAVTGLSEAGNAVGSVLPGYMTGGTLPRGVTFSATGVREFQPSVPGGVSEVDGISPDGTKVIGRVGAAPAPTPPNTCCTYGTADQPAWLSLTGKAVPLAGAAGLKPSDVNNAGTVVGSKDGRAMLWQSGRLSDLGSQVNVPRGWTLTDAVGINNRGDIAATAVSATGETMAVKLVRR